MIDVKIMKLDDRAILPQYQSKGASGFDLHAVIERSNSYKGVDECVSMFPGEQRIIRTGLAFSIPEGYEMQIRPRSGLAAKFEISVTNSPGTIDSDYVPPNEVKIILKNNGREEFLVKTGDRIAQGVMMEVPKANFSEIKTVEKSDEERNRGGGFGSTGVS